MELRSRPSFTVLIVEDDPDGEAILDIAEAWHAHDVLTEFGVVTPAWVTSGGPGPSSISMHLVGGAENLDLMTFLGSRSLQLVRLIVLNVLTHEDSSGDRLVRACDEVGNLIKRAMPLAIDAQGVGTGVRLLRINLLVPESSVAPQQRELIQPGWELNAVVSPEDRPDLDRMNVFVRSGVNLAGHALEAAATLGALWSGMGKAAFDEYEMDSTFGGHEIHVIRCQAKLIVDDDRVERLASDAIHGIAKTRDGAVRFVSWGYETERPELLVSSLMNRLVELPEWKVDERRPEPLTRAQIPMANLVRDWFRFQAALPATAVGFLSSKAIDTFERSVTGALVGTDAGVIGRIDPVTPETAGKVAELRLQELAQSLEPLRLEEHAASWGQTTPAAWRRLRDLSIGLVDGSELPEPFVRQFKADLAEVLAPSWVVSRSPQPQESPAESHGSRPAAHPTVEGVGAIPDTEGGSEGPEEPSTESDSVVPPDDSPPQVAPDILADSEAAEPAKGQNDGQQRAEVPDETHGSALLDRLAAHVNHAAEHEAKAAEAATASIRTHSSAPSTATLQRSRSLCVVGWIIAAVLLAGVVGWVWLSVESGHAFSERQVWTRALAGVLIAIAVFLLGGHLYYRALRRYEWQVRQRMHALRVATDEYVSARQQEKRWEIMRRGLSDWVEILGSVLHAPFTTEAQHVQAVTEELPGVPAAVAVAVAMGREDVTDSIPELSRGAAEALCTQGWLREEFARLLTASPSNNPEGRASSGDLPADLDLGLRANGPRQELVRAARSTRVKQSAAEAAIGKIRKLAVEGRVEVPDLTVVRTGPYSSGHAEEHTDFFSSTIDVKAPFAGEIFSEAAQVSGLQMPSWRALTLPPGVKVLSDGQTQIERSGLSLMTRVDVSPTLRPDDVSLFVTRTENKAAAEATVPDDFN
jgi:hypothetical protein